MNLGATLAKRIAALKGHLVEGRLQAYGTFESLGSEGPIGRLQWDRAGISINVQRGDLCEGVVYSATPKYTGVVLRRLLPAGFGQSPQSAPNGGVQNGKAEIRAVTKEKSKKECTEWLCELMRASLSRRTHSKEELLNEAQRKWAKTLSENAFEEARRDAIRITNARAWGYPGPTRRSNRAS